MGLVGTCVLCTFWGLLHFLFITVRSAGGFSWDLCFVYLLGLVTLSVYHRKECWWV